MDWALEDNMVDGLFFCATLTGRRVGHTPLVQAAAETSDTGAEVVKPDPGSSWEGYWVIPGGWVPVSEMKMRNLVGRPVTSVGHQEGRRVFWEGPKNFGLCPIVLNDVQHIFPEGEKIFLGGIHPPAPPLVAGLLVGLSVHSAFHW